METRGGILGSSHKSVAWVTINPVQLMTFAKAKNGGEMFDKRLLAMVPGAAKYILADVGFQWIALVCNIALFVIVGQFLQLTFEGAATPQIAIGVLAAAALAIAVRMACQTAAQRMGQRAAAKAKCAIRQQVYDKLVALGPAYNETVATSVAVQVSVEGTEPARELFRPVCAPAVLRPDRTHYAVRDARATVASCRRGAARMRAVHSSVYCGRAKNRPPHHAQLLGQLLRFGQYVSRGYSGPHYIENLFGRCPKA